MSHLRENATLHPQLIVGLFIAHLAFIYLAPQNSTASDEETRATTAVKLRLTVTSPLRFTNTPLTPEIDFPKLIRDSGGSGVLDPNSIEVFNTATGEGIPHALSEDFAYRDKARIEWIAESPHHTDFEIRFRTVAERPALKPSTFTPQVGVGDLLRYNAARPMPIAIPYSPGLHDLDGDGRLDLTGTWNYAYRPNGPWDGIVCYRRTPDDAFEFGDLVRLRYVKQADTEPQFFGHTYMAADFADLNLDGHLDLVMTGRGTNLASFYLNTGKREIGGMPRYEPGGSIRIAGWQACRVVDLDNDGVLDVVVDGTYVRNENPRGWPFLAGKAVTLTAGRKPCFLDIDSDGRRDAVCLRGNDAVQPDFYQVAWRKNLGGAPPTFGEELLLPEIAATNISLVAAWHHGERSGLIVQHRAFAELSFFELQTVGSRNLHPQKLERPPSDNRATTQRAGKEARRTFLRVGRAESASAVMALSDQAWPCLCDWDADGDQDLLIGGGYGWPRIVINAGSRNRPSFLEPRTILADGKPIRLLRNELLGKPHNWHDMGYSYPVFVDWDGDGLQDLVCPNETNRIFWYHNQGTPQSPAFGPRQQIVCDGYPDSPAMRTLSATRALDPKSNNGVYPYEEERPFFWRTGAAIADFNGDGLTDLVTHDGHTRQATLFTQYRHDDKSLRLRKDRVLQLVNAKPINDTIVNRRSHWTESFRAIDWDGDGLQDLVYSVAGAHNGSQDDGSIYLLRNVGTKRDPLFAEPETMRCFGEPIRITNHGPHPWLGDFDGDGRPDLIACVEWSVYPYYSHAALMMPEPPSYTVELVE